MTMTTLREIIDRAELGDFARDHEGLPSVKRDLATIMNWGAAQAELLVSADKIMGDGLKARLWRRKVRKFLDSISPETAPGNEAVSE